VATEAGERWASAALGRRRRVTRARDRNMDVSVVSGG
jgi:hypothetical protein